MDVLTTLFLLLGFALLIAGLVAVFGSFFTVETSQVAIVQRLGKIRARCRPRIELEDAFYRSRGTAASA